MKILVLGGTAGIGKLVADHFSATAVSRSTGHALPENIKKVLDLSLEYDIIINCVPDESQNLILESLWEEHKKLNLSTYFITVGSMGYRFKSKDHHKNLLQEYSEKLLFDQSKLRHTLVNPAWCYNAKDESPISLVEESQLLDIFKFLVEQYRYNSVISLIEVKGK